MLLHGDNDTDVPYEQSVLMAGALADVNIPHRFVTIDGGEHVFDRDMADPATEAAFQDVEVFLAQYV
jgi:dipeptidyl aminopeptidase/acylaminoacyl peptidase